jgi:hypothetical protein
MVKNWFYNYGRKQDRRDKITYVQRWNLNQVVGHIKEAEIQELCKEETGSNPGTKGYLSGYQKVLAKVMEDLSPEEVSRKWQGNGARSPLLRRFKESEYHHLDGMLQLMSLCLGLRSLMGAGM